MTVPNYLIWAEDNQTPYVCELDVYKGLDDDDIYALWQGRSLRAKFPADAEFHMNLDFPENTVLADTLNNIRYLIIGSERLKSFLESQCLTEVEYLKVAIRDHKGKKAAHYYIVNPLEPIDCIDHKASGTVFDTAIKTDVDRLKRLVLRDDKLEPERRIFRISGYPNAILVREDLARAIGKAFRGIKFKKIKPGTK